MGERDVGAGLDGCKRPHGDRSQIVLFANCELRVGIALMGAYGSG